MVNYIFQDFNNYRFIIIWKNYAYHGREVIWI